MKPIPMKLLIHTATHNQKTGVDAFNKATKGSSVTLKKIRCEHVRDLQIRNYGDQLLPKVKLFWDAVHSLPAGQTFTEGDFITFDGVEYTIQKIRKMEDTRHVFTVVELV